MTSAQLRILPHAKDEFPTLDLFTMWLLGALRARGGTYYFRNAHAVKDLLPGSIALFRYENKIVGEAIVQIEKTPIRVSGRTILGDKEVEYEAVITFAPSSIRLYSPPVEVSLIQGILGPSKDLETYAGVRPILEWSIYPMILATVTANGCFLS